MTIIMAILKLAAAFGMLGGPYTTKVVLSAGGQIDQVVANLLTPLPLRLQCFFLFVFIGAGLLLARKASGIIRKWAVVAQVVRVLRSPLVQRHGKALLAAVGPRVKRFALEHLTPSYVDRTGTLILFIVLLVLIYRDPVPTVDEMLRCQRLAEDQEEPTVKNPRTKKIRPTTVCPPRILRTNLKHGPDTTDDLLCLVGPSFQLRAPKSCGYRSRSHEPGTVQPILKPSRYSKKVATVQECKDLEKKLRFHMRRQDVPEFCRYGKLQPDCYRRRKMQKRTRKRLKKQQQRQSS